MQKILIVQENSTLKNCIDASCPLASFAYARALRDRDIKVNGIRVSKNQNVAKGDTITMYLTEKEEKRHFYDMVFEDDEIIIVDKASGVSSEALFKHLKEEEQKKREQLQACRQEVEQLQECIQKEEQTLYFIHRLDRNTSGLLIFAKTERANVALLNAFQENRVYKVYHALVVGGKFLKKQAKLQAYLKKDAKNSLVKIYNKETIGALPICTEYEVLKELKEYTLLKIILHTGRTHQIRAHLASIGHAVLGDEKYGDRVANAKYRCRRQILVAKQLQIDSKELPNIDGKRFESKYRAEILEKSELKV